MNKKESEKIPEGTKFDPVANTIPNISLKKKKSKVSKRKLRDCIFFWTEKSVIRFFRKNFEKKHYKNLRSVYMALCEINSDFGEEKKIGGFTKTVATYAGLGIDTASVYLRAFKEAEIIDYQQNTENKGKFGKTTLYLYKWEKESANLVSILMDAINKFSFSKKPSTENTGNGKQGQRKTPVHKNISTKVEISSFKNFDGDDAKILNTEFSIKKEKILNTNRDENFAEDFLKEKKDDFSAAPLVKNYFSISLPHYKELYDKDHIEFNNWLSREFKNFDFDYLAADLRPKFFNGIYHIFPKSKYPGTKESGEFAFGKFCRKKDTPVLGEILFAVFAQMKSSRWQNVKFISSLKNWFDKDKWKENPAKMINKDKKKHIYKKKKVKETEEEKIERGSQYVPTRT